MTWTFEAGSAPAQYRACSFPNNRSGIFYLGQTPIVTLASGAAATTTYEVRDFFGTVVSSGSVTLAATTVTPATPVGGWRCGWYRFYLYGPTNDSVYGLSAGGTSFCIIRTDSRFPTIPSTGTSGGTSSRDLITKAIMGLGTSRLPITNTSAPETGADTLSGAVADTAISATYWHAPAAPYVDSVRTRALWTPFDTRAYDVCNLRRADTTIIVAVYCKDEFIDGSTIFVAVANGTSTGKKITIAYPTSGTIVETYDNITDMPTFALAINAASAVVKVWCPQGHDLLLNVSATAIGRNYYTGVRDIVIALYPSVKYFEGPENEPRVNDEAAHKMRLFAAAVHAGNASAKAMGPSSVDLGVNAWTSFFQGGGGTYCDAIATHDYGASTQGNFIQGRQHIARWKAVLALYGQSGKDIWQTEAGGSMAPVYGVHHPRRGRTKMLHTLLWEQQGVPRERNAFWYDTSHGFWAVPVWWQNGDRSLTADAPLHRTLAEETFGKLHASTLSFGTLADRIVLASRYDSSSGNVIVQVANSYMPTCTLTYTITGTTDPLTLVDSWGNTSTVAIVDGLATVAALEIPTYIRLPAGVTATPHHFNDWPNMSSVPLTDNALASVSSNGSLRRGVIDGVHPTDYPDTTGVTAATPALPDGFVIVNDVPISVDRVVIWSMPAWQNGTVPVDFDVQSSTNGSAWTTRATVTKTTPSSFKHGTDTGNVGCQRETFWDEQWIFDVKLPSVVTARYFRLYVRTVSNGGEPDAASVTVGGQGGPATTAQIVEVALLCDDVQVDRAAIIA